MKTSRFRFVLSASVFLLGCAAGGVASRYVATASAAPPGAPRWQYMCFKDDSADSLMRRANIAGKDGWEMAAGSLAGGADFSSPIWCFKRPR